MWESIPKRLQHRCFSVKNGKCLRGAFFKEHLQWLLLKLQCIFYNYAEGYSELCQTSGGAFCKNTSRLLAVN